MVAAGTHTASCQRAKRASLTALRISAGSLLREAAATRVTQRRLKQYEAVAQRVASAVPRASFPLAIRSATRAKSWVKNAVLRDGRRHGANCRVGRLSRFPVFRGARKSSACATASASIARTLRVLSTTRSSLFAAVIPIETKSSLLPEVVIESTEAGWDQHFVLADQRGRGDLGHHEAGVQSCARCEKGRQVFVQAGFTSRSSRRSEMPASALRAMARKSSANASGSP